MPEPELARASAYATPRARGAHFTPLRISRDYRLLWAGQFISELGYQFARVAIYVQVFELTGSAAAVGLTGSRDCSPCSPDGSSVRRSSTREDRRSILMWSQVSWRSPRRSCWRGRCGRPARPDLRRERAHRLRRSHRAPRSSAMTPRLVGNDLLPSALTLNQVLWQTVNIVGPAVAGV